MLRLRVTRTGLVMIAAAILAGGVYAAVLARPDVAIVTAWFLVALTFTWGGFVRQLRPREYRLYVGVTLAFPVVEFALKWLMARDAWRDWWFWLNRIEHWAWMTGTVVLLYPAFRPYFRTLPIGVSLVMVLGLACLVGNLNEFWEYARRVTLLNADRTCCPAFYADTLQDMIVNVAGGLTGFLLLRRASR